MLSTLATTNFDHNTASFHRIQRCVEHAFRLSRPNSSWLPTDKLAALTDAQIEAHRYQVAFIVNSPSPHQRRRGRCACGHAELLPLWPKDLRCPTLMEPLESDGLDPELDRALDRLAYVTSINPAEDGPGLTHDLIYRAIQTRLSTDHTTWPWTTAADVWACEPEVARRLGFDSFGSTIFAAHMIWPTEHCKRALSITTITLPETAPGAQASFTVHSSVMAEMWDEMSRAILEDDTTHYYEPEYGCSCLRPAETICASLHGDCDDDGVVAVASCSRTDAAADDAYESPACTASDCSLRCSCPSSRSLRRLNAEEERSRIDDDEETIVVPFAQGTRFLSHVLRLNRDALLPQLARLFRVAPAKEFIPMLHQFTQESMRSRLLSGDKHEVDWYLLKAEDVKACEERFIRTMGFTDSIEAQCLMSFLTQDKQCPSLHTATLYM